MDSVKYIGMDVHKETISIAVRNSSGKLVMEYVIETKTTTILQFFQGIHGTARHCTPLHTTFGALGCLWENMAFAVNCHVICRSKDSFVLPKLVGSPSLPPGVRVQLGIATTECTALE